MGAKPPRAVDLTCVAALSLGLNLDVSFGRFSLFDVPDSGRPDAWTFLTRDPDAFLITIYLHLQP